MPTVDLLAKALDGKGLSESERLQLSPPLLAHLAVGGYLKLWVTDRRRMSKIMLAHLAICGCIELTKTERNSLNPQTLAILTASRNTKLDEAEFGRLPLRLRQTLKHRRLPRERNLNGTNQLGNGVSPSNLNLA